MLRIILALTLLLPATARAQSLSVRIESPHAGVVHGPLVELVATVSDPAVRHATLVVNGASYDVPVEQGRVEQQIPARPGNNRVALLVRRAGSIARDSLTFHYEGPPMELFVLLTWPSEGEIIDLWVREPGGETCKWDHRETASGGYLMDYSSDAIGFGSQGYVLPQVRSGAYRLKIHYWGAFADDDARAWWTYRGLLNELDAAELRQATHPDPALREQIRGLRGRLDQWARPAAPQTSVHAEVMLFPGTPYERRWRFDRVVQRTGQLMTLGQVEISDVMIRAAREARR